VKINLFLRLLYRFFQVWIGVSFWVYFRRIVFINKENLKAKGPLLILSNHPNTLMDPLMTLYRLRERASLLANYSLFKNPITNWLLSRLYCIPIQRPKDVMGQIPKNDESFKKCDDHLTAGGSIYIAAEGTSFIERHIRNFKTGAARIAFSAENKNDFKLDLKVLLVGITYTNPLKFRGDVALEMSDLIDVAPWRESYEKDPRTAIQDLTQYLENEMKNLVIHCRDVEEDAFLLKAETILQHEKQKNTEGAFRQGQVLLTALNDIETSNPDKFINFKIDIESYYKKLNTLNINDLDVKKFRPLSILTFILGLPIFVYGLLNNLLTVIVCEGMIKILKVDFSYDTTIRYATGLFLTPLFWWLQTKLLYHYVALPFPWWVYVLTIVPSGLAAWHIYKLGIKIKDYFIYKKNDTQYGLSIQRQGLVKEMEDILR
jgi:glycerol-3-phosphate O-acyltransferase / dihydroxyacetone phosphate acyltransferase